MSLGGSPHRLGARTHKRALTATACARVCVCVCRARARATTQRLTGLVEGSARDATTLRWVTGYLVDCGRTVRARTRSGLKGAGRRGERGDVWLADARSFFFGFFFVLCVDAALLLFQIAPTVAAAEPELRTALLGVASKGPAAAAAAYEAFVPVWGDHV